MDIDSAIRFGLDKLKYDNIKQDQKTIVESYIKGKDSFFCSQTGSGKSLTFEIAPFVFQYLNGCHKNTADQLKPIVLVISPLSSLMKSQVQKLKEKDINAVYLKSSEIESSTDKITIKDIISEDTDILFASPEAVLEFNRPLIMELSSKSNVKTIFIDEAHCIKKL